MDSDFKTIKLALWKQPNHKLGLPMSYRKQEGGGGHTDLQSLRRYTVHLSRSISLTHLIGKCPELKEPDLREGAPKKTALRNAFLGTGRSSPMKSIGPPSRYEVLSSHPLGLNGRSGAAATSDLLVKWHQFIHSYL